MANFDWKIEQARRTAENALSEARAALQNVSDVEAEFQAAHKFTAAFLEECQKAHISKVAIGVKHKSVPASEKFPFGASGSVFQFVPKSARARSRNANGHDMGPAIWRIVDSMGISAGCGNTDQHQIKDDKLIDGVYHLRAGAWHRVA